MALDARRRQKKAEHRKAKQSAKKLAVKRRGESRAAATFKAIGSAPILHCFATDDIWTHGIGQVLVSRSLPGDCVAASVFLVDVYCLGVKDATFDVGARGHYDLEVYGWLRSAYSLTKLKPACTRKLVEGAVSFAADLGLPAHPDYGKAKLIFGDIDPGACEQEFAYGRDGKPFFVAGPYDTAARCKRIVDALTKRCGPNGFHLIVPQATTELLPIFEGRTIEFDD